MSAMFEGRKSDSPYIDRVWRGCFEQDYMPICPADTRWNLLFLKHEGKIQVFAEGALSQAITKIESKNSEFLVIQFKLGTFMPDFPAGNLINDNTLIDKTSSRTFWLKGSTWEFPNYENIEVFIDRLVRNDLLVCEPVVNTVLHNQSPFLSERTIRRRFLQATGLTPKAIQQIKRARQAATLLEQGVPMMDVVFQTDYADQSHMTRSLRHYFGKTPTMITQLSQAKVCPICSRPSLFVDLCLECSNNTQRGIQHAENHFSYTRHT